MLKSPRLILGYFVKKENGMRKIVVLLVFILSSNIFAAVKTQVPTAEENIKPVRIAFFIDDHSERFGSGKRGAITGEFARTLSKKTSHVTIVSNYVLKNMILRKYTENPDPFLDSLTIDLNDWDIYQVKNTHFFIFASRDYDNPIFNKTLWTKINLSAGDEYNGKGNKDFPIIPWAKDIPIEAKRLLSNENMKYITYAKDTNTDIKDLKAPETTIHKKFDPTQLSLIFKPLEDYEKLSLLQPCNIFINGHGSYSPGKKVGEIYIEPEKFTVAGMSIEDMANMLIFFNDKLNTKSVRLLSCYSGGKILDLIQVKNYIPIRIKYLFIVDSITDAPSYGTFPVNPKGYSGLDFNGYFEAIEKFQDSTESFSDKIKTIKSKTTEPPKVIKSEIKRLEKNSGLEGVLEKLSLPPSWYIFPEGPNGISQILIPEVGWFQTFNFEKITDARIIKTLAKPELIEGEEVEIEDTMGKTPQTKKVIIDRLKKMYFAEAGTLDIKQRLALLLYSEIVFANINIIPNTQLNTKILYQNNLSRWLVNLYKYFPSISCFNTVYSANPVEKNFYVYPQFISMQRGDSLNLFAKINIPNAGEPTTETGILNFLRDSFLILRNRKSEKTFFIKELEGFNDFSQILDDQDEFKKFLGKKKLETKQIILQNTFIRTSRVKSKTKSENFLTHITISFNFSGKAWNLSYITKDLNLEWATLPADKSQSLWRFKESELLHKNNLKSANLTYLAELNLADYYAQLPVVRYIFQSEKTNIKLQNPSATLSFKDFIEKLNPVVIKQTMIQTPVITADEWIQFEQQKNQFELHQKLKDRTQLELRLEQQFRLQMNLRRLKTSLGMLKQKLLMLSSKLELLNKQLTGAV